MTDQIVKELKLPADTKHVPSGREYANLEKANQAWEDFNHELEALTERYGVHACIFQGALIVKAPYAVPEFGPQLPTIVNQSKAGGCLACIMFAIAQGMLQNPATNQVMTGAFEMFNSVFEEMKDQSEKDRAKAAFDDLDVKGPKQ
jgi:hypothetical protein